MSIRKCSKCHQEKEYPSEFTKRTSFCKKCRNKELKEKNRQIRSLLLPRVKKSKEDILIKSYEWRKNNPEKRKKSIKKYNDAHIEQRRKYYLKNRDRKILYSKNYIINNRDRVNSQTRNRRKNPIHRLRHDVSVLIRHGINGEKCGSFLKKIPYTIEQLKEHLQSKFESWMTWDNWGTYNIEKWNDNDMSTWTWQIDHIIPHAKFKYSSMEDEDFKKCWALENLRPYSAKQNVLENYRK